MESKTFWKRHYFVIFNYVKLARLKYKFILIKPDFLPVLLAPVTLKFNSLFYSKKIHRKILKSLLKYQVNRRIVSDPLSIKLIESEILKYTKNINSITKSEWKDLAKFCVSVDTRGIVILNSITNWINRDSNNILKAYDIWNVVLICSSVYHNQGLSKSAYNLELIGKRLADSVENRQQGHYQETSYFSSIGHLSMLEFFIKGKILGEFKALTSDLIYVPTKVANEKIALLLKETAIKSKINVIEKQRIPIDSEGDIDLAVDKNGNYTLSKHYYSKIQRLWDKKCLKPLIHLNVELTSKGEQLFNRIQIPSDAWIVGLHLRTPTDYNRNNRNSSFKNYKLAVDAINKQGGLVIRTGTDSDFPHIKKIKFSKNEYLFDLRKIHLTNEEREILHCYIWAKSKFFIGNLSGGTHPPSLFGTPILWTDVHPISNFRSPNLKDLILPKKIYFHKNNKLMTLNEILNQENEYSQSENTFVTLDNGYYIKNNDEYEIRNAVYDMINLVIHGKDIVELKHKLITDEIFKQISFDYGAYFSPSFISKFPEFLKHTV